MLQKTSLLDQGFRAHPAHPSHVDPLPMLLLPWHSVNKLRDVLPSSLNASSAEIQISPALEAAVTNNSITFIILTYPIYESGQA